VYSGLCDANSYSPGSGNDNTIFCYLNDWHDCDDSINSIAKYGNANGACETDCADTWATAGEITGEYIDTVTPECCGDDSLEVVESCQKDVLIDWACSVGDSCCASTSCVQNGVCYDADSQHTVAGSGDDKVAYCVLTGVWWDCDGIYAVTLDPLICSFPVAEAGSFPVGEYSDTSTTEYCGDDDNEYYAPLCSMPLGAGVRCCLNSNYCYDDVAGTCVMNCNLQDAICTAGSPNAQGNCCSGLNCSNEAPDFSTINPAHCCPEYNYWETLMGTCEPQPAPCYDPVLAGYCNIEPMNPFNPAAAFFGADLCVPHGLALEACCWWSGGSYQYALTVPY
jgi:hypothetical protein